MVRIVKLDGEPVDAVALLLHIDEDSAASVGEAINCINVVNKDNLSADLQVQDCLKWCVLDTSGIVGFECLYCSARVFGFDCEKFSLHLVQFGLVSGVDFGVGAVDVDGVFETGISFGTNSGSQQINVFFRVMSCSHPVQQVPIRLVVALTMVGFKVDNSEKSPQVSNGVGQGVLFVRRLLEDVSGFWRLELIQVTKDKNRDAAKDPVNHCDFS